MAHLSGIHIGKRAQTLAAVLALGAAILSVSAGPVHAEDNDPIDEGVRCTRTEADGTIEFYLPYDEATRDQYGHWQYCGSDGEWHNFLRTVNTQVHTPNTGGGKALTP
jgi:hypothetical protein